ncbi:hypothetical protein DQ04_04001060 [Trypanosoma grayi]|uniref:hypothetical protein n=1 Tax=Trypanosoma grayi TaxID=71804 RepID=UPI0004F45DD6|nr:hypothetical protein DQ04_04001060 [Trypanosoma grayi]KEG10241.1 hypothetical protein DQ04_04001060 [Trypanosoma grayi]
MSRNGSYGRPHWAAAAAAAALVLLCLTLTASAASAAVAAGDAAAPCGTAAAEVHRWGFRGAGYHMQLEVEFPLLFDGVRVSLDLPRAFFFDAAEVEQLYSMSAVGSGADIRAQYARLHIASTFVFDIEAPAFRTPYDTNSVNITFARLPTAAPGRVGKGVLLLPIHARYEEADATTPFSLEAFFNRQSNVRRCIPAIAVQGTSSASANCSVSEATMERHDGTATAEMMAPPNCQLIPVGVLSSLPFVYAALMTLQCVGAAVVVVSLVRA